MKQKIITSYLTLGDDNFRKLATKVFVMYDQTFTILKVSKSDGKFEVIVKLRNGEKRTLVV